ncbi:MAG TPA: hypothetical protein VHW45_05715 [Candidatus Sulfotelmatobacter sp.]|nr:hypothetical protein [Candidatus Sulfotelmatobacter sp.]
MAVTVESTSPPLPDLWTVAAIAICATVITERTSYSGEKFKLTLYQ